MSVAELTISYIGRPGLEVFGRIKDAELEVSSQRKKTLLICSVFSFVCFTAIYLYLAGTIVKLGLRERDLKERLDYALILTSERESDAVKAAYGKTSDFFAANGYEKPLSIEIIKRSFNVAEIQNTKVLY